MNAERAATLVRRWVSLYTRGLPDDLRRNRRDEIDDDLWCQKQEAAESGRADHALAGEILARLVFGIPADVTWRTEQRRSGNPRPAPEGSHSMRARPPAVLAILGGAMWAIWPIPVGALGLLQGRWTGEPAETLTLVCFLGGTVLLALATAALAGTAEDLLSPLTVTLAILGALASTVVALGGFYGVFGLLLSSALVVWQLGRVGAIGRWLSRAHVAAATVAGVGFLAGLASSSLAGVGAILVPGVLVYACTWLGIGWSLLRSGSVAPGGMAGASAA